LRLVSWMRAKLFTITATPPRWRGSRAACSRLLPSPGGRGGGSRGGAGRVNRLGGAASGRRDKMPQGERRSKTQASSRPQPPPGSGTLLQAWAEGGEVGK
jgi:hypothetical protein